MAVKHYKDEIPPSGGRTYKVNGVVSTIEDTTAYQQEGSGFGAADVNAACVLECNYSKSGTVHRLTTENTATENLKFAEEFIAFCRCRKNSFPPVIRSPRSH